MTPHAQIYEYAKQLLLLENGRLKPNTFLTDQYGEMRSDETPKDIAWPYLNQLLIQQFIGTTNHDILDEFCTPKPTDTDKVFEEKRYFMLMTLSAASEACLLTKKDETHLLDSIPPSRTMKPIPVVHHIQQSPKHVYAGEFLKQFLLGDQPNHRSMVRRFAMFALDIDRFRLQSGMSALQYTWRDIVHVTSSHMPIRPEVKQYLTALTHNIVPSDFWDRAWFTDRDKTAVSEIRSKYIDSLLTRYSRTYPMVNALHERNKISFQDLTNPETPSPPHSSPRNRRGLI